MSYRDDPRWQTLRDAFYAIDKAPAGMYATVAVKALQEAERRELERNAPGGARRTDPATSRKARYDVMPRTGSLRAGALRVIVESGERGMTYAEVDRALGTDGIWKRISELKKGDWVYVRGTRRVPETGSEADVYCATRKARAQFEKLPPVEPEEYLPPTDGTTLF